MVFVSNEELDARLRGWKELAAQACDRDKGIFVEVALTEDRGTVVVLGVADGGAITAPYEHRSEIGLALVQPDRVPGLIAQTAADAKAHRFRP